MVDFTLHNIETLSGPVFVNGSGAISAIHFQGGQTMPLNTTSSPFVMNSNGYLTLYNPVGYYNSSAPFPLVTKGTADHLSVVGTDFATNSYGANAGALAQDSSGNQYYVGTPLTELPSGWLPAASLYTRFRCFGVASSTGADTIQCGYKTANGSYAYTPNLAQAVTSSSSASMTLAATTAASSGSNQSSAKLYFSGNAYSTVSDGSFATGPYLQNLLTNTAQSPLNTLTLGTSQAGGLTSTFAVDFSSATGGFKVYGLTLTDTGITSSTVLGTDSRGVVGAASTIGSGKVVLANSPIVNGLADTGTTTLTNLIVSGNCTGCGAAGPAGPAGVAGPQGPVGSGLLVKDVNGNIVGTLLGVPSGATLQVYKSGYIVNVNIDGTFPPAQFWWSNSSGCNGTPYLNDGNGGLGGVPTYSKTVTWSGATNTFYIPSGGSINSIVTSVAEGTSSPSFEKPARALGSFECDTNSAAASYGGWALTEFNPATTLGWNLTTCTVLANGQPQSESCLAGPLQLP
jgi:hypothetical protein